MLAASNEANHHSTVGGVKLKLGTYYLGRAVKIGAFTDKMILKGLTDPSVVILDQRWRYAWAIRDVEVAGTPESPDWVFGRLVKFRPEGEVAIVDQSTTKAVPHKNLLRASGPFVYLPEYSGLAYFRVANHIEANSFTRRLEEIIHKANNNPILARVSIEHISDLEAFIERLLRLDTIRSIEAKVHPPNPLFGRAWKSLRDYLESRNTSQLTISEKAADGEGLSTSLPALIKDSKNSSPDLPNAAIGDSALLMATDGYGSGSIKGMENGTPVSLLTKQIARSFQFKNDPSPSELASEAAKQLDAVTKERSMTHGHEDS